MFRNNPLLLTAVLLSIQYSLMASSYVLPVGVTSFDASKDLPTGVDTIFLATDSLTTTRGALKIKNLIGNDSLEYVITNLPEEVFTLDADSFYYALSFENCHYFKVTGDSTQSNYTFRVTEGTGTAVSFGAYTSDFTIQYIEVFNATGAGIKAKTYTYCGDPDTRFFPSDSIYPDPSGIYVMKNVNILDNYIHDTGEEGMYIGESFYPKRSDVCGNIYSHEIHNITIKNNKVSHTGWDGIQVGCATVNCSITNNEVVHYGEKHHAWHSSGFQLGHGTSGECAYNWVEYGFGHGILLDGVGENKIFNNVLLQIGKDYVAGSSCALGNPQNSNSQTCDDQEDVLAIGITVSNPDSIFYKEEKTAGHLIFNNTILGAKSGGILFEVDTSVTLLSKINNNVVGDYNFLHSDELGVEIDEESVVNTCNNFIENDKRKFGFINDTYNDCDTCMGVGGTTNLQLSDTSILVNSGTEIDSTISLDFYGSNRMLQGRVDIGAYEYSGTSVNSSPLANCPCDFMITSFELNFDGSDVSPGDTVCLMAGKRSVLEIENLIGEDTAAICILNHGGSVTFEKSNSVLFKLKNSSNVVINGSLESHSEKGLHFEKEGTGSTTGIYLANVNDAHVKGVSIHDADIGIRYRFDKVDSTLTGERKLTVENVSVCSGQYGLYFGYSSGYSGQDAWELGEIRADNVVVDSVDVGMLLYGVDDEDTVAICNSTFKHIEQYAVKTEQNSMELILDKNLFSDIGYNSLYSKSSYNQPFRFNITNNVIVRSGNTATLNSDQSIPVFVNFQNKSGSLHAYHNTIAGFESDLGLKVKYASNAVLKAVNNLFLGENSSVDFVDLNGDNASGDNYENSTSTSDTVGFSSYYNDDLSISSSSVWVNSGDTSISVLTDKNGAIRSDSVPDIGAYEYVSSSKMAPLPIDNTEVIVEPKEIVSLFPNPSQGYVQIESDSEEEWSFCIMNAARQVIRSGKNLKRSATVDIADLSKGLYFVKIVFASKNSIIKRMTKI